MLYDTQPESPQPPRASEAGSGPLWPAMIVPAVAVLVTSALFVYAIEAGGRADQGKAGPVAIASKGGDFAPQAGWVKNLSAELSRSGPGQAQAQLAGSAPSFADLPAPVQLPKFLAAEITNTGPADIRLALAEPPAAQKGREQAAELQEAGLASLSIEFPANSARIPPHELTAIRRAAELIKGLPEGTKVELVGHIAGPSVSHKGAALAKKRAEAVFHALVRQKVDPARLSKIVSAPEQAARAEAQAEGRSTTMGSRRVEFRIVGPNVPWHKA